MVISTNYGAPNLFLICVLPYKQLTDYAKFCGKLEKLV